MKRTQKQFLKEFFSKDLEIHFYIWKMEINEDTIFFHMNEFFETKLMKQIFNEIKNLIDEKFDYMKEIFSFDFYTPYTFYIYFED